MIIQSRNSSTGSAMESSLRLMEEDDTAAAVCSSCTRAIASKPGDLQFSQACQLLVYNCISRANILLQMWSRRRRSIIMSPAGGHQVHGIAIHFRELVPESARSPWLLEEVHLQLINCTWSNAVEGLVVPQLAAAADSGGDSFKRYFSSSSFFSCFFSFQQMQMKASRSHESVEDQV